MSYLQSYQFQRALSIAVTVVLCLGLHNYLEHGACYWLPLAALLVNPISCGASLRQSLLALVAMIVAVLLQPILGYWLTWPILLVLGSVMYGGAVYFISNHELMNDHLNYIMFTFTLSLLFAFSSYLSVNNSTWHLGENMRALGDVLLGGGLAIVVSQLILIHRQEKQFRYGLIPVLYALRHYNEGISKAIAKGNQPSLLLSGKRSQLENSLQAQRGLYPNWVYEIGFNYGLRKGYRFFLINLEMLAEAIFSLANSVTQKIDVSFIESLEAQLKESMQKNNELLDILIHYFSTKQILLHEQEFMKDIYALEKAVRKIIPGNLELLEIMPDYIQLVAFIRIVKDIRERLLQLVLAVS